MSIPQEKLTRILKAAAQAPSGDNSQPWKFQIRENTIRLLNVVEKNMAAFINYNQSLHHIALGAALENLKIAAESEGLSPRITLFPDKNNDLVIADVLLEKRNINRKDELFEYIEERSSNRKKYKIEPLSTDILEELKQVAMPSEGRIVFVNDRNHIETIAYAISGGEKIALENKDLHDYLFSHVTWNEKDELQRHGFYIKTFEFKPPQEVVFRLFRNWTTLSFFKSFGVTDFIAKDMEGVYRSSGAFGAIVMRSTTKEDFVTTGMLLERLWLTATKLGLSLQPTTGIHFLELPIRAGTYGNLSQFHQDLVKERYKILTNTFNLNSEEIITFAFRIGFAEKPSARTTRAEPRVEILQ